MKTYHIKPTENGWEFTEDGDRIPLDTCWTKWQAMESAAEQIGAEPVLLKVYRGDGSIEEELQLRNGHDLDQHFIPKGDKQESTHGS
jgi:hypothetical protein